MSPAPSGNAFDARGKLTTVSASILRWWFIPVLRDGSLLLLQIETVKRSHVR